MNECSRVDNSHSGQLGDRACECSSRCAHPANHRHKCRWFVCRSRRDLTFDGCSDTVVRRTQRCLQTKRTHRRTLTCAHTSAHTAITHTRIHTLACITHTAQRTASIALRNSSALASGPRATSMAYLHRHQHTIICGLSTHLKVTTSSARRTLRRAVRPSVWVCGFCEQVA